MSDTVQEDGVNQPLSGLESGWAGLRVEREARGLSLNQVSAQLKLAPRQLEAIERGDLSALPGSAFSRGFVRNYARFLQLDPAPFLALIDASEGRPAAAISSQIYSPSLGRMPTPGNPRFSALPAALMVLLLAGVLGAGWYFQWFEVREEGVLLEEGVQSEPDAEALLRAPFETLTALSQPSSVQSMPRALASSPASASTPAPSSGAAVENNIPLPVSAQSAPQVRQSAPSAAQGLLPAVRQSAPSLPVARQSAPLNVPQAAASSLPRIVLAFEGESWVEVRDAADKVVFARMNQAGVLQEVQGNGPFVLVIGNAPKVKLSWKGKPVDLTPYIKGDVARVTVQ
ncbi:cytoskeleton protein RodZ [Uliginosibacterium flavum]|uniref:RodZ domain-containing protein n=1 Tax=Uliginosibacterium flavum TaxID=1396831 RepID=A0ABV2TN30_9RHOO